MAADRVFLGLGSNLGDRLLNLRAATARLPAHGVVPVRLSSVYDSEPVGPVYDQPAFFNAVIEARTELEPRALLVELQAIERELGRQPGVPKGPRLIDLDLLLFGDRVAAWPELVLPHPEMGRRAFVLAPLIELAPDLVDPRSGQRFGEQVASVRLQPLRLAIGSIA